MSGMKFKYFIKHLINSLENKNMIINNTRLCVYLLNFIRDDYSLLNKCKLYLLLYNFITYFNWNISAVTMEEKYLHLPKMLSETLSDLPKSVVNSLQKTSPVISTGLNDRSTLDGLRQVFAETCLPY